MTYSIREIRNLKVRIDAALKSGRLSPWERQFLTNIRARIAKFGAKTRLSDKQRAKIFEIVGKAHPNRIDLTPRRKRLLSRLAIPLWILVIATIGGGAIGYFLFDPSLTISDMFEQSAGKKPNSNRPTIGAEQPETSTGNSQILNRPQVSGVICGPGVGH